MLIAVCHGDNRKWEAALHWDLCTKDKLVATKFWANKSKNEKKKDVEDVPNSFRVSDKCVAVESDYKAKGVFYSEWGTIGVLLFNETFTPSVDEGIILQKLLWRK